MASRYIRACRLVLLAGLVALPVPVPSPASESRRSQAQAAYEQALRLQRELQSQPDAARRKSAYHKLIRTFREVYRLSPASSKAPVALAAVAETYAEMARVFSADRYYGDSVQAYKFLIAQYPYNPATREALYQLGELYRAQLHKPAEARQAFETFLKHYPRSERAAEVREKLKDINLSLETRAPIESGTIPAPSPVRPGELPSQIVAIRRWVGPNYTRIVIGLEGEAKFDASRLSKPDRIVLDLSNTLLSRDLARTTFAAEEGYLRQIRLAQFKPNTARVVLDVTKIEDYSVFTLPNPFRLIVDIHGAPAKPDREKALAPTASGSLKSPAATADTSASPKPDRTLPSESAQATKESTRPTLNTKEGTSLPPASQGGAGGSNSVPSRLGFASDVGPGTRTLTRVLGLKIGRVVIDPGHGGHDTGTIGPTGLREKDVVLDVALRLKKLLARNMAGSVILTREDDTFIALEERTAIANERAADLFISIHANASRDRSARGVETYYLNFASTPDALEVAARENATSQESVHELQDLIKKIAMTEKIQESQEFARLVQRRVHGTLSNAGSAQRDRGLKKAPFVVLIGANMPSILAEISFLTNPRDERLLKRASYRQKIAQALYLGIARYVSTLGQARVEEQARRGPSPAAAKAQRAAQSDQPNF